MVQHLDRCKAMLLMAPGPTLMDWFAFTFGSVARPRFLFELEASFDLTPLEPGIPAAGFAMVVSRVSVCAFSLATCSISSLNPFHGVRWFAERSR